MRDTLSQAAVLRAVITAWNETDAVITASLLSERTGWPRAQIRAYARELESGGYLKLVRLGHRGAEIVPLLNLRGSDIHPGKAPVRMRLPDCLLKRKASS